VYSTNIRISKSFFKNKDIHRFTRCACETKSVINYVIANLTKDVRVYGGAEVNTGLFLLCSKLQFPPRRKNCKNYNKFNERNHHLTYIKFKIMLLNDSSIKWLYRRRIEEPLENITESTTVE
jgi:hypothetical protein